MESGLRRDSGVRERPCSAQPDGVLHGRTAVALSDDHKPNRNDEHDRIEAGGGAVIWAGTWRVAGVLAVSRAFGDRPLKKCGPAVTTRQR